MIKKIFTIILLTSAVTLSSAENEIEITRCSVSELSPSQFLLTYSVKNNFDTLSFSNLQVTLPFEKYILQGSVESGFLTEKDFLFSQTDIDLNGDSDFSDSYKTQILKNKFVIGNKNISPVIKSTPKYNVLIPFDESGKNNVNRIAENGAPFILINLSAAAKEILIGLNPAGDIEFRKFSNSVLMIEVISPDRALVEKVLIDGEKSFMGLTNEKDLTGGENSYRTAAVKNIIISDSISSGNIKLSDIRKPFSVRVTYYFALSENLILLNQKILKVN